MQRRELYTEDVVVIARGGIFYNFRWQPAPASANDCTRKVVQLTSKLLKNE
jgi:hypothetical protein